MKKIKNIRRKNRKKPEILIEKKKQIKKNRKKNLKIGEISTNREKSEKNIWTPIYNLLRPFWKKSNTVPVLKYLP